MQRRAKSADQRHQETRGDADENGEDHQPQFAAPEHGPQPAGAQIVEKLAILGARKGLVDMLFLFRRRQAASISISKRI